MDKYPSLQETSTKLTNALIYYKEGSPHNLYGGCAQMLRGLPNTTTKVVFNLGPKGGPIHSNLDIWLKFLRKMGFEFSYYIEDNGIRLKFEFDKFVFDKSKIFYNLSTDSYKSFTVLAVHTLIRYCWYTDMIPVANLALSIKNRHPEIPEEVCLDMAHYSINNYNVDQFSRYSATFGLVPYITKIDALKVFLQEGQNGHSAALRLFHSNIHYLNILQEVESNTKFHSVAAHFIDSSRNFYGRFFFSVQRDSQILRDFINTDENPIDRLVNFYKVIKKITKYMYIKNPDKFSKLLREDPQSGRLDLDEIYQEALNY